MRKVSIEETIKREETNYTEEQNLKKYFIENVLQTVMIHIHKNVFLFYYVTIDKEEYIVFEDMNTYLTCESITYMQCITADSISAIVIDFAKAINEVWG